MDAKVSTKTKTMQVQNLFRYISFKAKSLSHCLTELFPIYQNKHWTIRRSFRRTIVPLYYIEDYRISRFVWVFEILNIQIFVYYVQMRQKNGGNFSCCLVGGTKGFLLTFQGNVCLSEILLSSRRWNSEWSLLQRNFSKKISCYFVKIRALCDNLIVSLNPLTKALIFWKSEQGARKIFHLTFLVAYVSGWWKQVIYNYGHLHWLIYLLHLLMTLLL